MIFNKIAYFVTTLLTLTMLSCNDSPQEDVKNTRTYSGNIEQHYVAPTRIITQTAQVKNAKSLLKEGLHQAHTAKAKMCIMQNEGDKKALLVLDFGKEIHGGISIITGLGPHKEAIKVRIRLGESVSEAMSELGGESNATNEHGLRDWVQELPWCGKVESGNSGFRFASIELLEDDVKLRILEISAIAVERDIEYQGAFKCNDERLNKIWLTGARTVHLNMQEFLWDGPKRDRLVWVGDMHPEVKTIAAVFGHNEVVPNSLDFIKNITPLPEWMNSISSYSMWWLIIHHQWYMNFGEKSLLEENKDYILELLQHLSTYVDENGKEELDGVRFLDWPTSEDSIATHAGLQSMMVMTFDVGAELAQILDEPLKADTFKMVSQKLRQYTPDTPTRKSPAALMALADLAHPKTIANDILLKDGVHDLSTFYGYYVLNALAKSGNHQEAIDYIREYWGAMLDLGATSFWEDFNIDWMENAGRIDEIVPEGKVDVHKTYGEFCYVGFRHSLCHGWASGPTAWLSEYVLGVEVIEPGCKALRITPHLGDLEWVEGKYPTPLGVVKIKHTKEAYGKVNTKVEAPKGIRIIIGQ